MAITESELNISNQSYTNKDFDSVYTELLSLAKSISYKYDPTASNESDPFIILLKLLAFATDKVNYQIDKNILERFMPSATQDSSMRDLTSRLGYNMHYYVGAQTQVVYKYTFPSDWEGGNITIPAFTSIVKPSIDTSITYVPTADGIIDQTTGQSQAVDVIQGTYKTLTILDNTTIQLENLDENKKVYFPETMVAQNGVFITGGAISELFVSGWYKTDNLNSEQYGAPCYFFGYDSERGLPYLQFPDWISVIIGAGLTVNYVVTQGAAGNVRAKSLDTVDFTTSDSTSYSTSDIIVVNTNAATNGGDPETIDEAYQGFKKTIGTFDTLVTCRDYANAIYNLLNDSGNKYVSNVQVADRRTDINYALNMAEYDGSEITESEVSTSDITPYDLCLYPFKPVSMSTVTQLSSIEAYRESFRQLTDLTPIKTAIEDQKTLVHTYKTLNSTTTDTDIFCIKNYYELNAIISTTYKVDTLEQASILLNVNGALASKFYSRNVDFGYEIPYDELLSCIETADTRIKSVSLFEPVQTPTALMANGTEVALANDAGTAVSDWFRVVAIKNIVSGRVALFAYDELFNYAYDKNRSSSDNYEVINTVKSITTNANISGIAADAEYVLKANEALQFIAPNYIDYYTYPYGVNYYLELSGDTSVTNTMSITSWTSGVVTVKFSGESTSRTITAYALTSGTHTVHAGESYDDFLESANSLYCFSVQTSSASTETYTYNFPTGTNNCIPKDTEYQLRTGDKVIFEYVEDDVQKFVTYTSTSTFEGKLTNIIKPNFDMYTSKFRQTKRAAYTRGETALEYTDPTDGVTRKYFTLSTNQEIASRQVNQEVISISRKFYWSVSNTTNTLEWEPVPSSGEASYYEYLLKENEELFHTDLNATSLYEYGSGTRLQITPALYSAYEGKWTCSVIQDLSQLTEEGISGFVDYFKTLELTPATESDPGKTFTIEEQQIITLTTNDSVKNVSSSTLTFVDNTFTTVTPANFKYKFETDETYQQLPDLSNQTTGWRGRALLDVNAGPELVQTLCGNQSVTVTYDDASSTTRTFTASQNWSFQFDSLIQVYGGEDVSLALTDLYYNTSYPKAYFYVIDSDVTNNLTTADTNYVKAVFEIVSPATTSTVTVHLPQVASAEHLAKDVYVMCYVSGIKDATESEAAKKLYISYEYNADSSYVANKKLFTPYNLSAFETETEGSTTKTKLGNGLTIIKTNGVKDITFTATSDEISLVLSLPRVSDGINPYLDLLSNDLSVPTESNDKHLTVFEQALLNKCGGYTGAFKRFYATTYIDTVKELELSKSCKLSNAQAFYDTNNIANAWTIPEINFDTNVTSITIARSSQK